MQVSLSPKRGARGTANAARIALLLTGAAIALLALGCSDSTEPEKPQPQPDPVGTIRTVVGTPGTAGFNGDTSTLALTQLNTPRGLALDPTGLLVVADTKNQRVRACTLATDHIETRAGSGTTGTIVPGPALDCPLNDPVGLAWNGAGELAFSVAHNSQIVRVDGSGVLSVVAGSGTSGFAGDGGPAVDAQFDHPVAIAYDTTDNLYILDSANGRIRRVTTDGNIATYAGIGGSGYAGDDGPAAAAQFNWPHGQYPKLAYVPIEAEAATHGQAKHSYDRLYVPDTGNHRVRVINMVSTDITLQAGNGTAGYAGDGGPALDASLNLPTAAVLGSDDSLYIADTGNHVVRKVDALGLITTIAGTGVAGYSGDGGPATSAALSSPVALCLDEAAGKLYIADTGNHVIRSVLLPK